MLKTHRDKMTNIMKSINAKKKNNCYRNRLRMSRSQVKLLYLIYLLVNALNLKNAAALVNDEYQLWSKFLLDQRSERNMAIGSVDVETTNQNKKKFIED